MKKMLLFLTLLWVGRVTAQVTETGGGNIQQALNTVFQNVDMAQVPTGLLMSKSIYFTNIHNYDGTTLSDSTNLNINTLGWLYAMLNMSNVGTNTFPSPESLYGENSYNSDGATPLVMLCERYAYIKPTAFEDNLLSYSNGQIFDEIHYPWETPYAQSTLFAVSPVTNYFKTGNLSFRLTPDRIVQNVTQDLNSFGSFSIDFGTGNGFQTYFLNQTINVTLPSGKHHATMLMNRPGQWGNPFRCRFDIEVAGNAPVPESGGPDDIYRLSNSETKPVGVVKNGSDVISAEVTTFFACTDKKLRKPLLILDGFNSGGPSDANVDNITLDNFLPFFNGYQNTPISTASTPHFITQDLRKEGYDLIFVNWKTEGGRADLRDNALLLQEILKRVNEDKVGTEKNVIIGISMGGVVAKYAILDSERKNPTAENGGHDVKLLIGYDSPMQGANISLGFQYFVKDFGEDVLFGLGLAGVVRSLEKGLTTLKSPAARQLLTYQAFDNFPRTPYNFGYFFNELNAMGKPQKCDYKTVSNGSLIGTPNFPAGKRLMNGGFTPTPLTNISIAIVGFGTFISVDIRALPPTSANWVTIYERRVTSFVRIFGTYLSFDILPPKTKDVANMRPLDGCPGGTTDVTGDIRIPVATFLGFGSISGDRYDDGNHEIIQATFIPTVSALDIQTTDVFLNVLNQPSSLTSGFVGSRSDPQFDAAQFIGVAVGENRVSNQVHGGLSYRTTGFLLYELLTKNALQTSGDVTLSNRTYNFGTTSDPYPTSLPQTNGFNPKRTTNIIDYTLNVTNTGKLWVNRSGKIGFQDDVNAALNATINSPYSLIIRSGESCKSSADDGLGVLNISSGGTVIVGDPSTPTNASNIRVLTGGTIKVKNGGNLNVTEKAQIIVENGGTLIIDAGANINLGALSKILIKKGGELIINGNFNFTGQGYFQFDQGHVFTATTNLNLTGSGNTSKFFVLSDAPTGTENILKITGYSFSLTNALINYGANTQIDLTNCPEVGFGNCIFSGYTTLKALNIANTNVVGIGGCNFSYMSNAVFVNANAGVSVSGCTFSGVNNCVSVKGIVTSNTQIWNSTFNYNAWSVSSGIACRLENGNADIGHNTFIGSGLSSNTTAIELKNAVLYASNGDKISNFKTGINAEISNSIEFVGLEISGCETGIYMIGGGIYMYGCSKIVNNQTGIKGTNIGLDLEEGSNTFQTAVNNPNSLLLDICYPATTNPMNPVYMPNNYWVGGFESMKFRLMYGCPNGTRRKISVSNEWTSACDYSQWRGECDGVHTTFVNSDGAGAITSTPMGCFTGGGGSTVTSAMKSTTQPTTTTSNDKLSIYPNPATETVKLYIESGNYTLKALNTVGQTIFTQNTEGSLSVDVSTWTNGIYLFEVTNKATNKQQRHKIVVQH